VETLSTDENTERSACGRTPALSDEDKQELLRLARRTLEEHLGKAKSRESRLDSSVLLEPCATFVTLRKRDSGELRGCRGECPARRPLIESVARMVIAAARDDSRFSPVTADEVSNLRIEISALSSIEPIEPEAVVVGQHGLLIIKGSETGLLLPQVPVRLGWDREQFLRGLCQKAHLPDDAWRDKEARLYGFEAEAWAEQG
jgi:AmmeMemoRadiSam system protein A